MTTEKAARPMVEQTAGEKMQDWYDNNGKWINIVLIAVLVGIVGYKTYEWIHTRNVEKANIAYSAALNQYQQAMAAQEPAEKKDKLGGAITAAEQVVAEHGDTFVGREAQLMIGNAQYGLVTTQSGDPEAVKTLEKARDSYQKYINIAADSNEQATGYLALGNVLENLSFINSDPKVMQEAVEAYKQALAASDGTYLGSEVKLSLARALSAINSPQAEAEAAKLYQEVAEKSDVQLVSDGALEPASNLPAQQDTSVSPEEKKELLNLAEWSHKAKAEEALARLK